MLAHFPRKSPLLTLFLCKSHINTWKKYYVSPLPVEVCRKHRLWMTRFSVDLVGNLIKSNGVDDSSRSPDSYFPCSGCRALQAAPNLTPENDDKIFFLLLHIYGIKYTAEQPFSANHLQTVLITSSLHVSLCGFSSVLFQQSVKTCSRCSMLGFLGRHFIPITPGESSSTVNLERGENLSWQSIPSLRYAGVSSTLNSVHRANWITHDCRSISRRPAGMPAVGASGSMLDLDGN